MIKEKILELCKKYESESSYDLNSLCALVAYETFNSPYFKNQYAFLKTYKNIDDVIVIGSNGNKICGDFCFDFTTMTAVDDKKDIMIYSLLLNEPERELIEKIKNKVKEANCVNDIKNMDISKDEFSIIVRHLNAGTPFAKHFDRIILDTKTNPYASLEYSKPLKDKYLVRDFNHKHMKNDISFIKRELLPDVLGNLVVDNILSTCRQLENDSYQLATLLEYDDLEKLIKDKDNMYPEQAKEIFNYCLENDYIRNNTAIGVLLSVDNKEDRVFKLIDIYKFKEYKSKFINSYQNILDEPSIEYFINKDIELINNIKKELVLNFPFLENKEKNIRLETVLIDNPSEHIYPHYHDIVGTNIELVGDNNFYKTSINDFYIIDFNIYTPEVAENEICNQILFIPKDELSGYGLIEAEIATFKTNPNDIKILSIIDYNLSSLLGKPELSTIFEELFLYCKNNELVLIIQQKSEEEDINQTIINQVLRDLTDKYSSEIVVCLESNNDLEKGDLGMMTETSYNHIIRKSTYNYKDKIKLSQALKDFIKSEENIEDNYTRIMSFHENYLKISNKDKIKEHKQQKLI